ncbi:BAG family molecular chaperone regulator 4 isoform X3 [Herpailurus yagouaroundi]|uniref:BAG family molecular chaperone regulator 4 isoform X3 n=1 Tax=Herpailurus yagouaroundi TaxID=1608482 RepID=UPI001AD7AF59|nr:BAG family molecular chaperone regulator 4 isoform X3 [Puma yagouaroundi]
MSALRRSGYGPSDGPSYGRYYGPGGGDVPMHPPPPLYPPRPEPPQPPISWRVRGGGPAETTWPGEGGGGDGYYASAGAWSETGRAGGSHQDQPPYPSYNSNYWNSARPRAPYPSTYPVRPEMQGQNPGMTLPHYPYGDGNRSVPQPGPTVRQQEDSWASPGAYGMGTRYPWPSAAPSAPPGNLYMSESTSSWPSSSSPQSPHSPPPQQPKDSSYTYSQSDQGMNRHNFPCNVHQYESSGTMNNDNSDLLDSQVQYSAEPQLYGNATNEHPSNQDQSDNLPEECLSSGEGTPPSIKKIIHVLEKVQYLEQEVEEFVGKKTDKAYWLLEEMLTKELLELDSVETGGQDSVRQARKEAVCKIQAILEKLEKKGL